MFSAYSIVYCRSVLTFMLIIGIGVSFVNPFVTEEPDPEEEVAPTWAILLPLAEEEYNRGGQIGTSGKKIPNQLGRIGVQYQENGGGVWASTHAIASDADITWTYTFPAPHNGWPDKEYYSVELQAFDGHSYVFQDQRNITIVD